MKVCRSIFVFNFTRATSSISRVSDTILIESSLHPVYSAFLYIDEVVRQMTTRANIDEEMKLAGEIITSTPRRRVRNLINFDDGS